MRLLFATLALAGAICTADARASEPPDRIALMSASDVVKAVRCPPPLTRACKRIKERPKADFRSDIAAIVDAAATAQGVPVRMARAVVKVESGGNPHLRGRQGEYGLYQIKCQTARGLGFSGSCGALSDPTVNARFGTKHLRLALDRGSPGFHQAGLGARRVSQAYVNKINAAMR